MKKLLFIIFFLSFVFLNAQQQKLSDKAEISVLTIAPGLSLNDAFGHNGFRIKDETIGIDIIYGYGEYDFNAPNFYLNFARGKLNYLISKASASRIFKWYSYQNRTIKEQVLNLTLSEKQELYNFLQNNYQPENRRYLYDFFYDNCATKIRDVISTISEDDINFNAPKGFKQKTFRQLIHDHVDRNSWGGFGIDLALGSVIDKKATAEEHMFLPYYIHVFFESATINTSRPLVKQTTVLFESIKKPKSNNFATSPLFAFGVIGLLILLVTIFDYKKNKRSLWLDVTIFAFTGIVGIIVLLLWFATNHSATAQNYNLLWAFALNIFVISQLFKKIVKTWFIKYLKFLIIMMCLLALHWIVGVQIYAIGLIPILIAFFIRYLFLIKYYQKNI
ncbi:MAG: hypothetical protein DRI75_09695 [Bacteroidetes bacterium]|nr:MAG: hypothetical protein DRI75_09695 [Bacteroidota bacterium]